MRAVASLRECAIEGCDKAPSGRHCAMHTKRIRLYGDPDATPRFNRDPDQRFWAQVEVGHPAGCWYWAGVIRPNGYGKFTFGRRTKGERRNVYAHRFAYETLIGLIPEGMQIDHLCRNRVCVNPDHLEIVTPAEHMRRSWAARAAHCRRGHLLKGSNLYIQPTTGRRACQTCKKAAIDRWNARRKGIAA